MSIKVAIDGPSGAGKSSISKWVANRLGFIYIDTGAMYRAVGLFALRAGIDTKSAEQLGAVLDDIAVDIKYDADGQLIFLNGENVTTAIRTPEASIAASDVSAIPAVRLKLVELQRQLAEKEDVIMDGRDIGTYVLPGADVKIFLTASVDERAGRRFEELKAKGTCVTFDEVKKDIEYRDANDSSRAFAPLKPAEDSIILDTTGNTFEQSAHLLLDIIETRRFT